MNTQLNTQPSMDFFLLMLDAMLLLNNLYEEFSRNLSFKIDFVKKRDI